MPKRRRKRLEPGFLRSFTGKIRQKILPTGAELVDGTIEGALKAGYKAYR